MSAPSEWELRKANRESDERERQVLFGNEAFALGALQTVSAATAFGILSQFTALKTAAGELPVLIAFTGVILSLACSVLGFYYRHLYKMWHVKGNAVFESDPGQANRRFGRSNRYLGAMRNLMTASAVLLVGSLLVVLAGMWFQYLSN